MAAVAKAHLPHGVAVALEQCVADVFRRHLAQGRGLELAGPSAGGEAAQQVLDHAREREELLVVLVHETSVAGPAAGRVSLRPPVS